MSSSLASYLLLHRGRVRVFVSGRHDAPTVPQAVMRGPRGCVDFVRRQERQRVRDILDPVSMEGGIAIHQDEKRALFFGGTDDVWHPVVRERLLERLRPLWAAEGYTIDWAERYAYDLVLAVGLSGTVLESGIARRPGAWADAVRAGEDGPGGLVGRRTAGTWTVRRAAVPVEQLIPHGARILDAFDDLRPLGAGELEAASIDGDTALLLDEDTRAIAVVAPVLSWRNAPFGVADAARAAFPGFTVGVDLDPSPSARMLARGVPLRLAPAAPREPEAPWSEEEIEQAIAFALSYDPNFVPAEP